jgi:hypothetical protein
MKLIDADEIMKRFLERSEDDWNKQTTTTWAGAYEDISDEIDDEEECIVRCKDCKFGFSEYGYVFCTKPFVEKGNANHNPDWFCADGERR